MGISRRQFLEVATVGGVTFALPSLRTGPWLQAAEAASHDERILVVVQLSGGNDGLNTIVPFTNDDYFKARKKIRVAENEVLKLNDELGFHPQMKGLAKLFEDGKLCVPQGVGYADPNRSHFKSMEIWHTCVRTVEPAEEGWLGKAVASRETKSSTSIPSLHLGSTKQPLALASRSVHTPSVESLNDFRLTMQKSNQQLLRKLTQQKASEADSLLDFVEANTASALDVSAQLEERLSQTKSTTPFPEFQLSNKLKTISQLIGAGVGASVYYVELDGFDTHAFQLPAHGALLQELSQSLAAFQQELTQLGVSDRVLTFCFSEFGRRVEENASEGTDHGTAAPLFLLGDKVQPGFHGAHPSLTDLDQGDLKFHTDFRQVYATILESWLGCDSRQILSGEYKPLKLIS